MIRSAKGALSARLPRAVAMPRDQAHRAIGTVSDHESLDLPNAHSQALSSDTGLHVAVDNCLNRL